MKRFIKLAVLLLVFGITSCDYFKKRDYCPDDSKNLGNNLKLGTYIGSNHVIIVDENNREFSVSAKEILFLREDSSFTYFAIANNDTIKKVSNGNFKIYQDVGYPWYVFELKSDSIYERVKMGTNEFRYTDFVMSEQSITLAYNKSVEGNLLSNINNDSNCFSFAYKVNPHKNNWCDPDWEICCDKMILKENKTFCLKQPEETPEQKSIGDSL